MCGFVAIISATGQPVEQITLERMADLLAHRGPDGSGTFVDGGVGFGFRRLAIFDLAPSGDQPMASADGRYVIVFNGAIYNFVELREELRALGHTFRSTGDTEVLLTAWLQWGRECLNRLNGMWAFLIYDRLEKKVFGARDRFGVKPLFWCRRGATLLFASEIKAIRDSEFGTTGFDWYAIADYLLEERIDAGARTFYDGITRVAAGTCFEIDASGEMRTWRYWELAAAAAGAPPRRPSEEFAALFDDAVKLRMRSDVPVGVLLSGGLDSSSIMCSMARQLGPREQRAGLVALCYMDPDFDETPYIEATLAQSGGTLERLQTSPQDLWDALVAHLWHQDEPVHSFTSVVVYQLMKLARQVGLKVVLNGQGADEALGGYGSYFMDYWVELVRAGRIARARAEIAAFAAAVGRPADGMFRAALETTLRRALHRFPFYTALANRQRRAAVGGKSWIAPEVRRFWRAAERRPGRTLNEVLRWSLERADLPLYLRTEDRNSMAHGVELRLPFLDYRLVTFAFRLGSEWKIRREYTKVLLREAMVGRIPEAVRSRAQKFGFPTGADQWFRGGLHEPLRDLLASRAVRESGLWNVGELVRDLERHRRGEANLGGRLFVVAQLSLLMSGVSRPASALNDAHRASQSALPALRAH